MSVPNATESAATVVSIVIVPSDTFAVPVTSPVKVTVDAAFAPIANGCHAVPS